MSTCYVPNNKYVQMLVDTSEYLSSVIYISTLHDHGSMPGSRGGGQDPPPPPVKSQMAIGFLRNTGTDHPREAIGLYGPYTKEHIYVLVIVWFVRLYGKIIHELLRVDYLPYRRTNHIHFIIVHVSACFCTLYIVR